MSCCILLLLSISSLNSQTKADLNSLKSAYLERFTRFVEWPDSVLPDDGSSKFVLAVFGNVEFAEILEEVYKDQKIKGKEVEIRQITEINEIADCHLLYIDGISKSSLIEILNYTKDKSILTVSHSEGFASEGVIINLFVSGKKLRFEINEQALQYTGLKISHHLLKQARIVNPRGRTK